MTISATDLLAQSQAAVRLFGWAVGQITWKTPDSNPGSAAKAGPSAGGGTPTSALATAASAPPTSTTPAKTHKPVMSTHSKVSDEYTTLANILAFSHDGRYTPFHSPALFLMRDEGDWVWENDKVDPARLGLAQLDQSMVFASNLKYWICDRSAYLTRLDMSAGTAQLVVIDLETSGAQGRRIDLIGQGSSFMARLGQGH